MGNSNGSMGQLMKIINGISLLLALSVSGTVGATMFTTNAGTAATSTLINSGGAPAAMYCNSSGCQTNVPGSMAGYATITAWSTPAPAAASTTSPTDNSGTWLPAYLAIYSPGIGISNTQQLPVSTGTMSAYNQLNCGTAGFPACPSGSNPEHVSNAPQHAIDNNGVDDILVVDFGSSGWDVNSFSLGYTCNASTGVCGGAVAVEAWIGGANGATIDFSTEKFSANGDLNAIPMTGGFSRLTLTNDPLTGGTINAPGTTPTGRYLVITGALAAGTVSDLGTATNGYSDAFKVSNIIATSTNTGSNVPTPGSLPLLGLGLLALVTIRRRAALIS
jgi:uncharacterized protein (TIGR03382 family)